MHGLLDYPELLALIDERSVAFRAAVAAAPRLDVQVPSCPDWTVLDLAEHLATVHRGWADVVAAGPAEAPPEGFGSGTAGPASTDRTALSAWSAAATQQLLAALREAGPDRGCWTWWGESQSPQVSGSVARHQLAEVTVHTYDAQLAGGAAQPLPGRIALEGVDETLFTGGSTPVPWPHEPAAVWLRAIEGRAWVLRLDAHGARAARLWDADEPGQNGDPARVARVSVEGSASDLLLYLYDRVPVDTLTVDGDRAVLDRLATWEPHG